MLLRLLEEEHIVDARIPRLYYDALQTAIANGNPLRGKDFAERLYAARVILESEDSLETNQVEGDCRDTY